MTRWTRTALAFFVLLVATLGLIWAWPSAPDPAAQCDKPLSERVGGWMCPDGG